MNTYFIKIKSDSRWYELSCALDMIEEVEDVEFLDWYEDDNGNK